MEVRSTGTEKKTPILQSSELDQGQPRLVGLKSALDNTTKYCKCISRNLGHPPAPDPRTPNPEG